MGLPIFKVLFDRQKRASKTKEGSIEVRITYNRMQRFVTTGIRVLPSQWKNGRIVKRIDAFELQNDLDMFVTRVRKTVNGLMEKGELDMNTIVGIIGRRQKMDASENLPEQRPLLDYFRERTTIRKYGRAKDSQERYERFLRWFEEWGGMAFFSDLTEINILKMDEALTARGMKPYSKWNNYHRFLKSFIIDAMRDGILRKDPYSNLNIRKEKSTGGIGKYLTLEEFRRIEALKPNTAYLAHARDLFVFQTYTCLSYVDLSEFDNRKIKNVNGKMMYTGRRGKTSREFSFLLLRPAMQILDKYNGRLPMMSNVKYNEYLKAVALMADIDKPISSHWARHTGATMLLNLGVNMEIVSKVLGHSSTKITREVYAKLLDDTVAAEMELFERRLADR